MCPLRFDQIAKPVVSRRSFPLMGKLTMAVCSTLICSFAVALAQQSATASLSGRVVDPHGAVIVGAQITAKNKAPDIQRETKSNDQGLFVLTNLAPGEYEVKAEAPRFKARIHLATLEVGQSATLDVSLDVGGIAADDFSTPEIDPINTVSSIVDGV